MTTRALFRPVISPLVRGVTEPGYGSLAAQIRLLFAAGEQGAWYDPSDLSTLYQDSAGATPVTALGQPVGRVLDKRFGLARGAELNTDAGFDTPAAWTASAGATVAGGKLTLTVTGGAIQYAYNSALDLTIGKTYLIEFTATRLYGVGELVLCSSAGNNLAPTVPSTAGSGTYTMIHVPTDSNIDIGIKRFTMSGDYSWEVESLSVREIPGNHASQPTATARPVLAAGNKIDYDGVDDELTTTFPDLGSNVTIVRSVPSVGASILTGQTIGAGAWDDSTDQHGLLIINRALTAPETALVTRWANLRAGV